MGLEYEMAVYQTHLAEWLPDEEGKFVVIKGEEVLHTPHEDFEGALRMGYKRFGPVEFLVKKILPYEPIIYFTRDLRCPS